MQFSSLAANGSPLTIAVHRMSKARGYLVQLEAKGRKSIAMRSHRIFAVIDRCSLAIRKRTGLYFFSRFDPFTVHPQNARRPWPMRQRQIQIRLYSIWQSEHRVVPLAGRPVIFCLNAAICVCCANCSVQRSVAANALIYSKP